MKRNIPYINNFSAIFATILINIICIMFFQGSKKIITKTDVIIDSAICGFITSIVDVLIANYILKRKWKSIALPKEMLDDKYIQKLPKRPIPLIIVFGIIFSIIIVLINYFIMCFYDFSRFNIWQWSVYKLIYSSVLTVVIWNYCIYRFLQKDYIKYNYGEVINQNNNVNIKNPMPKIPILKEVFGSVTFNISLNIILGFFLKGSEVTLDNNVIIYGTKQNGIWISGIIFGIIMAILLTKKVACIIKVKIKKEIICASVNCVISSIMSAITLTIVMMFFNIEVLNFYQFCILITVWASIFSKFMVKITVKMLQNMRGE